MKILSLYTYLFEKDNSYYLLNTETLIRALISKDLYSCLKNNSFDDIDVETLNTLIAKHIIVEEEDKYNFYNGMKVKYGILNHETERMDLFIMPTLACNFACSYCFEGEKDNCFISEEVPVT